MSRPIQQPPRESMIVVSTHLMTVQTGDHHVALVMLNDGLQARSPAMTPDQVMALAAQLTRAAELARAAGIAAREAAAAAEAPSPPRPAASTAPRANPSRLI